MVGLAWKTWSISVPPRRFEDGDKYCRVWIRDGVTRGITDGVSPVSEWGRIADTVRATVPAAVEVASA